MFSQTPHSLCNPELANRGTLQACNKSLLASRNFRCPHASQAALSPPRLPAQMQAATRAPLKHAFPILHRHCGLGHPPLWGPRCGALAAVHLQPLPTKGQQHPSRSKAIKTVSHLPNAPWGQNQQVENQLSRESPKLTTRLFLPRSIWNYSYSLRTIC